MHQNQQAKKIKVLPTAASSSSAPPAVVKLRPTDNGLALQKVGTLHIANRSKLTEIHHSLSGGGGGSDPVVVTSSPQVSQQQEEEDIRSPTPDYDAQSQKQRGSRPRSKKKSKAPTAPSTPAASARSDGSRSRDGTPKRSKLRLFKTKSDAKSGAEENGRIRARSMEYLRADLADETQEIRRRRHSREDLSGDESLLAITKTGPVTVFSSQKKLNSDEDWEEMPRPAAKKEQFYFGMTPGDVAVATMPSASVDLDEESRRVMEEFDAVLADKESRHAADTAAATALGIDQVDGDKENHRRRRRHRRSSTPPLKTSSSSYPDDDDEDHDSIALNLRPTLPKKPQQLPRFSPSAAWRALGQQQQQHHAGHQRASSRLNVSSSKASDMSAMDLSDEDEDDDVMEDRISKNQLRPVAPHQPRNINEKSADSGISGDAGSPDAAAARAGAGGPVEKPLAMSSPVPQQQNAINNWTPQQDLQDDDDDCSSSSQEEEEARRHRAAALAVEAAGVALQHNQQKKHTPPKIIPKSQMFNDSMTDTPGSRSSSVSKSGAGAGGGAASRSRKYRKRNEDQAESGGSGQGQQPQKYNSLRKLKRSVSGAFATAFRRGSRSPSDNSLDDGNWVLSRSAPNSVLNGSVGESGSRLAKFHRSEADLLASEGLAQLAYQYPAYSQPSVLTQRIVYLPQYDSRIQVQHHQQHQQQQQHHHPRYRPRPADQKEMMRRSRSADAVYMEANGGRMIPNGIIGKKFTFQSTVRVNEKRVLEERLSREAELKERKRLQEQVAMQRVEEEFQRKRAREKANIRQQLRILQYSQEQEHHRTRLDPEGAPSSSAASHNRTSSDEFHQSPRHGGGGSKPIKQTAAQQLMVRKKDPIPTPVRSSRSNNNNAVVTQPQQQQQQQQQRITTDYRKEVIINSRTRSAAPPPPTSGQAEYRINSNGVVERNNNNIMSKTSAAAAAAPVVTNYKKPTSNIYKRLAEITSEEESISSPPPVPILVTSSSKHQQRSTQPLSSAAVHSSANGKVMTQELSEYRQERREYRDYRSPRHHQQQPPPASGIQIQSNNLIF